MELNDKMIFAVMNANNVIHDWPLPIYEAVVAHFGRGSHLQREGHEFMNRAQGLVIFSRFQLYITCLHHIWIINVMINNTVTDAVLRRSRRRADLNRAFTVILSLISYFPILQSVSTIPATRANTLCRISWRMIITKNKFWHICSAPSM